jgi:dipeptidyl aminopeptidase/acylaminoacyl peptidase
VNVNTGESQYIIHGTGDTVSYVMDGSGHVLLQIDETSDLRQHLIAGSRELASFDARGGVAWDIEGRTPDGNGLAIEAIGAHGNKALYSYSVGSAGLGAPLFSDPNIDIDGALHDDMTGRVIGVAYTQDRTVYKYFDPALEQIKEKLELLLPGESVVLVSHDTAGTTYVVSADGPKDPGTYYLYHSATGRLDRFKSVYPGLSAADLSDVQPYPYKSRDGLDIHAYLTLPVGKAPRNLPTVIFPHGGPEARDSQSFDWWAQFMASRGYAVLQPNFRGSTGYGVAFRNAGFGEWGKKVQNDITDGVQKLIADGIADPKRICIVGASYGGYAALAGATFTPNLYACAISYAGLSDLAQMRYRGVESFGSGSGFVADWDQFMGGKDAVSQNEADGSPSEHADQVKAPILLIHSDRDVTVPIEQSEIERDALQHAGKTVEYVKLSGDDHYLTQQDARIQLLKEVERFLAAHIGT